MALHLRICGRFTAPANMSAMQGSLRRVPVACVRSGVLSRGKDGSYSQPSHHGVRMLCAAVNQRHQAEKNETLVICNHKLLHLKEILTDPATCLLGRPTTCGHCSLIHGSTTRDCDIISNISSRVSVISNGNTFVNKSSKCSQYSSGNRVRQHWHNMNAYQPLLSTSPHDANWIVVRSFHTSKCNYEESKSKVQETVKALKEEVKVKAAPLSSEPDITLDKQPVPPPPPLPEKEIIQKEPTVAPSETETVVVKKSIGQRIIDEVKHYYNGFKLLFVDIRICVRLLWSVLNGKVLTRRERRQLVRTTADLFRMVPFLVFIVVPFMEFLLPVALKLFPGMLPSTFKTTDKEQEKIRINLKGKLQMAQFLQDTIEEMALEKKGTNKDKKVSDFRQFIETIRTTGGSPTNEDILKYSKLFKDELTLDNLQHDQLRALCILLGLKTFGTSTFLRFQLRMKLRNLEYDDRMIQKEGLESLTVWELQEACRSRGMRALGMPEKRLKLQLQQWLDLHLNESVPTSLLLLSRTLYLPESLPAPEQLKVTLSTLPETTTEEATVSVSEMSGERVSNQAKLELIRQEEAAIRKEKEEVAKEDKALEEAKAKIAQEEAAMEEAKVKEEVDVQKEAAEVPATPVSQPEPPVPEVIDIEPKAEEILVDKAPIMEEKPTAPILEEAVSLKDLEEIEGVLEHVAEQRMSLKLEQEEFQTLKEDVSDYSKNLTDLKEVILSTGGSEKDMQETKAAQRLTKRVSRMMEQMENALNEVHREKDNLMEDIEIKEVKMRRSQDLQEDDEQRQIMMDQISEKKRNLISINELVLSMRRLQKVPDDTRVQRIMQVLDEDEDGAIDIDDALKVIELLGRENVKVSASQMKEILDLIRKEASLQEEEKMAKVEEMAEENGFERSRKDTTENRDAVQQ